MTIWNSKEEPITQRLRDDKQILHVIENKTMMYNERSGETALVSEVFEVFQDKKSLEQGYSPDEDRWVEYVTQEGPQQDFSIDLDDEGWIWHDELENTND